jgi:hypothetical protein
VRGVWPLRMRLAAVGKVQRRVGYVVLEWPMATNVRQLETVVESNKGRHFGDSKADWNAIYGQPLTHRGLQHSQRRNDGLCKV